MLTRILKKNKNVLYPDYLQYIHFTPWKYNKLNIMYSLLVDHRFL